MTFEIGNLVCLQSGGSAMTVELISADLVGTVWMDREGKIRRDKFLGAVLRLGTDEFDRIGDLIISGVTHTPKEIEAMFEGAGNA